MHTFRAVGMTTRSEQAEHIMNGLQMLSVIISPGHTDTRLYYQSGLELLSPVKVPQ